MKHLINHIFYWFNYIFFKRRKTFLVSKPMPMNIYVKEMILQFITVLLISIK